MTNEEYKNFIKQEESMIMQIAKEFIIYKEKWIDEAIYKGYTWEQAVDYFDEYKQNFLDKRKDYLIEFDLDEIEDFTSDDVDNYIKNKE